MVQSIILNSFVEFKHSNVCVIFTQKAPGLYKGVFINLLNISVDFFLQKLFFKKMFDKDLITTFYSF